MYTFDDVKRDYNVEFKYWLYKVDMSIFINSCPQNCFHCYAGKTNYGNINMDYYYFEKAFKLFHSTRKRFVENLIGSVGYKFYVFLHKEVFIYKDWKKILNLLQDYEDDIWNEMKESIPTNAFWINNKDSKEILKYLKEYGSKNVQLSLHGLKNTHNKYVSYNQGFQNVMKLATALCEIDIPIKWRIFLNKDNLKELSELLETIKKLDVKGQIDIGLAALSGNMITNQKYLPIKSEIIDSDFRSLNVNIFSKFVTEKELEEKIYNENYTTKDLLKEHKILEYYYGLNIVDPKGNLYSSNSMNKCHGNIFTEEFSHVLYKKLQYDRKMFDFLEEKPLKDLCNTYGNSENQIVYKDYAQILSLWIKKAGLINKFM